MTALPNPHRFQYDAGRAYCGATETYAPRGVCGRGADHPIHDTGRPEINQLAVKLAGHPWRREAPTSARASQHAQHTRNTTCALCTADVHAIAAAVLEILRADLAEAALGGPHGPDTFLSGWDSTHEVWDAVCVCGRGFCDPLESGAVRRRQAHFDHANAVAAGAGR